MASPYQYSYSGADAKVYAYFDGLGERIRELESVHTISYSVHESKGQVRSLGFRGIRGLTRSVRTIAGSMIFMIIKDHPLRDLIADSYLSPNEGRVGWSVDKYMVGQGSALDTFGFTNRLPALMPPFNLLMTYVSELAEWDVDPDRAGLVADGAATLIKGVEFIDEGTITSVNDIVSEVTYSFVARDIKPISLNKFNISSGPPIVELEDQQALQNELKQLLGNTPPTRNYYTGTPYSSLGPNERAEWHLNEAFEDLRKK